MANLEGAVVLQAMEAELHFHAQAARSLADRRKTEGSWPQLERSVSWHQERVRLLRRRIRQHKEFCARYPQGA